MMKSKYNTCSVSASRGKWTLRLAFLLLIGSIVMPSAMLAQQTYTFTNCGNFGPQGPTQSMVNSAYASTNLNGSVTIVTQGIQQFTIPVSGGYRIEAWGGQGYGASGVGGRGAYISGEFNLTAGTVLKILVGQQGELPTNTSYNAQYGGGGGSFVTDMSNVPYVVAGGGGANWSSSFSSVSDAPVGTSGNGGAGVGSTGSTGGSNGGGGATANSADGGAGITGNGAGTSAGYAFVNGGVGGFVTYGIGGFGGGGGTSSFNNRRAGGGGGYSGGGGAEGVTTGFPEGGGGGSYNSGTNQTNTSGVNLGHGKVVISELCNISMAASANPICIGGAVTLTTSANTSTWSTGSTSSSITVSPTVTTTYSVVGTGSANCLAVRVITITVQPLPVLTTVTNPSLLCIGSTATVSASGAATYTWAAGTGSNTLLSPTVTTNYSVTGTSIFGCVNSKTFAVNVNTNTMGISASSPTVCAGSPAMLTISGVTSYTWSNGSHFQTLPIAPSTNTTYYATGRDANYCLLNASVSIAVNPKPNVVASVDRNLVCKGETTTLTANGASTYVWNGNGSGSTLIVTLPVDVTYTYMVVGTDSKGCSDTAIVSVAVNRCTGIDKNNQGSVSTVLFPNPNNGEFVIESAANVSLIEVSDVTGRVILSRKADGYKNNLSLKEYAAGVYYVRIQTADKTEVIKMIKE